MSYINELTGFYGTFFEKAADFAFYPYTLTVHAIMGEDLEKAPMEHFIFAGTFTAFFTLLVPILPALTVITISLAAVAVVLGLFAGCFAYPIAAIVDIATDGPNPFECSSPSL